MNNRVVVFAVLLTVASVGISYGADDYIDKVRKGNQQFKSSNYDQALELYRSAETEIPESPELTYNIAGALYKQGKYEEVVDLYTKALNTTDINTEAATHYNLGNTYFRMDDFQNAIKSYENVLGINPDDLDAKYNLELARKRLKEQIKPEQQEQDEKQQQQQEQQEQQEQEKQDQQEKDQEKQDEEQEQQQQDDQKQENPDEQQQQQQPQEDKKEMTKEDAERILNALKDEQDVQKKIKRQKVRGNYSGKDW